MTVPKGAGTTAQMSSRAARIRRRVATVLAVTGGVLMALALFGRDMDKGSTTPVWLAATAFLLAIGTAVLLVWRHQYPLLVTGLGLLPAIAGSSALAALIGLAAVSASRRDWRLWASTAAVAAATGFTLWLDAQRQPPASLLQSVFGGKPGGPPVDIPLAVPLVLAVVVTAIPLGVGLLRGTRRDLARVEHTEQGLRDEVARQDERTRIAREMHDVLGHRLSQLSLQAGALEVGDGSARTAEAARTVRTTSKEALDDLRQVIGVLREGGELGTDGEQDQAPMTPQPNLADIAQLVTSSRGSGMTINATVMLDEAGSASTQLGTTAYRIVQECLTNVLRHAPGATTEVTVRGGPGSGVTIEVANPLPAAGTETRPGSGTGLTGVSERVAALDGTLEHGSTEAGTFAVAVWLPWPQDS